MASVGDIMQVVLRGTYLGQAVTNVFHYQVNVIGGLSISAAAVNTAWFNGVLPAVRAMTNTGVLYQDLYTVNIGDPSEMDTNIINLSGLIAATTAEQAPSYMAVSYKYERTSALYRNGWKRFCGITENQMQGNTYVNLITQANTLATALAMTLTSGSGPAWQFQPFVARRPIHYGTNPVGYATNTVSFRGLSTQNSRKP